MPERGGAFFGITRTLLIIGGEAQRVPGGNRAPIVYGAMILQIAREYSGIPDVRQLTTSDIQFFYEGIRSELIKNGKTV